MNPKNRAVGDEPVILPRAGSGTEPQHLLLAMLGDHWFVRAQPLPSASLVDLLALFDVRQSSARQAMRRLAIKGHLVHYREGRRTGYGFPPRSRHVIETRPQGVVGFGRPGPPWNECFTIVVFSIPEEQRELRRDLRTQLLSLGFGNLYDAVWISPHDRRDAATELIRDLGVETANVFYGPESLAGDPAEIVSEAFDTSHLRELYEAFIADYAPLTSGARPDGSVLVARTLMVNRWLTLRTMDPNLPLEVLPADWPRSRAHDIFLSLYDRFGAEAAAEFRDVVAAYDHDLAQQTMYYSSDVLQPELTGWRVVAPTD